MDIIKKTLQATVGLFYKSKDAVVTLAHELRVKYDLNEADSRKVAEELIADAKKKSTQVTKVTKAQVAKIAKKLGIFHSSTKKQTRSKKKAKKTTAVKKTTRKVSRKKTSSSSRK